MDPKDLLIADLAHFGESFHRNEDIGEKRLTFFVTLVTAVGGGLVALATSEKPEVRQQVATFAPWAAGALLVLGLVTWLRMVRRNIATDELKLTLDTIRQKYAKAAALTEYHIIADAGLPRFLRGGYAETVSAIDGILAAALAATTGAMTTCGAILLGAAVGLVLWFSSSALRSAAKKRRKLVEIE